MKRQHREKKMLNFLSNIKHFLWKCPKSAWDHVYLQINNQHFSHYKKDFNENVQNKIKKALNPFGVAL